MSQIIDDAGFQEIFDAQGNALGAMLGPEAWALVREAVLERFAAAPVPEEPEPLSDWQALVQSWDFNYPVDLDVACSLCGNATSDWRNDEPRRFRLAAANFGGLVTFRCLGCQARILKRHFDDVIQVEVRPFAPEKSIRNKGRAT
ncbi:MAG: hypothetical protein KKA55_05350 [Proteobacteria bacterium]|nr:hypothetical protein [Pseudomonadota bacterium]MBU1594946.1 hypothetical protein [Pseudomonadota bacterium]